MQVLDLTLPTPAENLACDEALLEKAESVTDGEVLRFWESPEHFVVVGYASRVQAEANLAHCKARGVPILRRCTGGGTVVQGPGCLNYALILRIRADHPTANITSTNQYVMQRNRQALHSVLRAVNAELPGAEPDIQVQGHTDLTLNGLKFSGNAQRRRRKYLLFHGTFLLNFDLPRLVELLQMPPRQPAYRQERQHLEFVTNLKTHAAVLKQALMTAWQTSGRLTFSLETEVAQLAQARYATDSWNFKL